MPDEEAKPEFTTSYKGRTIAFCCEKCLTKFAANPQRYAARLTAPLEPARDLAATSKPAADAAQHEHKHAPQASGHAEESHSVQEGERPGGHVHRHEHDEASGVARFVAWLGRFHPVIVHFPIAMLIGAAVAESLVIATRRAVLADAARFCLWFGAISALVAVLLGWFFGGFHWVDDSWILATHRWLGTGTAGVAVVTAGLNKRAARRPDPARVRLYRVVLFASAILVSVVGFLGGAMVYGLDHYRW
jgi:uncharacterized membrane protein/YHS domain-containing protein